MDAAVVMVCLAALVVGVVVGLMMQRARSSSAVLEARQSGVAELAAAQQALRGAEARVAELQTTVAEQEERTGKLHEQVVQLSGELATARTTAARVPGLEAELEARQKVVEGVRDEIRRVAVQHAEAEKALERLPELEHELCGARDAAAAIEGVRETERRQASAVGEKLAHAQAELDAVRRALDAAGQEVTRLRGAVDVSQREVTDLLEEKTRLAADLDAEKRAALERAAEAERSREQVRAEIHVLATRLLDEKGRAMLEQSQDGLLALLKPVSEKLKEFEAKVDKTYDVENRDRASLLEQLRRLQDTQTKLHADAEALSRALTGESKAQGDWGELVLERVLEVAGLTEGRDYELQVTHVDEEGGRKRPDALVKLPGNRVVVVDAKCSLTAFVQAMRASDEAVRVAALDAHVASVRAHVKGLAGKDYQAVVKGRTVDIVLLFVPNEAAFQAAIMREAGLYEEAFRQRVIISSPTTLLAALQLISHVWRSENQNVNAQRIADEAGRLLDKLKAFLVDLDAVGSRLDQAQASFKDARSKLASGKGNALRKAADIVKLGARVKPDTAQALMLEGAEAEDDAEYLLPEGSGAGIGKGKVPVAS